MMTDNTNHNQQHHKRNRSTKRENYDSNETNQKKKQLHQAFNLIHIRLRWRFLYHVTSF